MRAAHSVLHTLRGRQQQPLLWRSCVTAAQVAYLKVQSEEEAISQYDYKARGKDASTGVEIRRRSVGTIPKSLGPSGIKPRPARREATAVATSSYILQITNVI